ncbi:MAG: histone deacetylase family protein [Thermoplasmata archaeon]
MRGRVALVYHPDILSLDFGEGHPLRSDRYSDFLALFRELGLDRDPRFEVVGCGPASLEDLLLAHSLEYIKEVDEIASRGGFLSIDTPINPAVVRGAMLAVGGALEAGRRVAGGENPHAITFGGFHHAGRDYGSGFCVFNDVAILALDLLNRKSMKRVMIIDTDAHAGDGTQELLASVPEVLKVTLHQDPTTIYPGRGFPHQIGEGEGKGFTVNIPLPVGSGIAQYERSFEQVVFPLAREFRPKVVIRNGGSDPHFADQLTALDLTVADFRRLGALVRTAAGGAPIVEMYGSGYNPEVLPACWISMISGTTGFDIAVPPVQEGWRRERGLTPGLATQKDIELEATLAELRHHLRPYWKCFS